MLLGKGFETFLYYFPTLGTGITVKDTWGGRTAKGAFANMVFIFTNTKHIFTLGIWASEMNIKC